MKKTLSILLILLLPVMCVACKRTGDGIVSPSPIATLTPSGTSVLNSPSPTLNNTPAATNNTAVIGGNGVITGFEEGKLIPEADIPEIVNAVMDKYPGATIKSIVHATYDTQQVYRVTLENAETNEVYVTAKGDILGPTATPAP